MEFQYEQIASFCYYCGKICHSEKHCQERKCDKLTDCCQEGQYGEWLKAEILRPNIKPSRTPDKGASQTDLSDPTMKTRPTENPFLLPEHTENQPATSPRALPLLDSDNSGASHQPGISSAALPIDTILKETLSDSALPDSDTLPISNGSANSGTKWEPSIDRLWLLSV